MSRVRHASARLAALVGAAALAAQAPRAAAGPIGVGVELGHPTGLSLEVPFGDKLALQAGAGTGVLHGWGLYLHAEALFVPIMLVDDAKRAVPLYIGAGLRLWDDRYAPVSRYDSGSYLRFGLNVPVGVAIRLKDQPLDFFFEAGLEVDVEHGSNCSRFAPAAVYCRDQSPLDATFGIGARYWFGRK